MRSSQSSDTFGYPRITSSTSSLRFVHDTSRLQAQCLSVYRSLCCRNYSRGIQKHPHQIHLCVAIVKYRTKLKIPRKGVCTSYLALLKPGEKLRIGILKGLIRLPPDIQTPIVCIGPGTGIAPMRAVIEERVCKGSRGWSLYPSRELLFLNTPSQHTLLWLPF